MKNLNTTLPTKEQFKEEAKRLRATDPSIEGHNDALNLLASEKYGYKNYFTIKHALPESIFPLDEVTVMKQMEEFLFSQGVSGGGRLNYFLTESYKSYKIMIPIFFNSMRGEKLLRNKADVMLLSQTMSTGGLFSILKREIKFRGDSPLTQALRERSIELCGENSLRILINEYQKDVGIGKNKEMDMWKESFAAVRDRFSDIFHQLAYRSQAMVLFFIMLSEGKTNDAVYGEIKKQQASLGEYDRKERMRFTEGAALLLNTSYTHDDYQSFYNDVKGNLPLDKRVLSAELLTDEMLQNIYDYRYSLKHPLEILASSKKEEKDINIFYRYIDDIQEAAETELLLKSRVLVANASDKELIERGKKLLIDAKKANIICGYALDYSKYDYKDPRDKQVLTDLLEVSQQLVNNALNDEWNKGVVDFLCDLSVDNAVRDAILIEFKKQLNEDECRQIQKTTDSVNAR